MNPRHDKTVVIKHENGEIREIIDPSNEYGQKEFGRLIDSLRDPNDPESNEPVPWYRMAEELYGFPEDITLEELSTWVPDTQKVEEFIQQNGSEDLLKKLGVPKDVYVLEDVLTEYPPIAEVIVHENEDPQIHLRYLPLYIGVPSDSGHSFRALDLKTGKLVRIKFASRTGNNIHRNEILIQQKAREKLRSQTNELGTPLPIDAFNSPQRITKKERQSGAFERTIIVMEEVEGEGIYTGIDVIRGKLDELTVPERVTILDNWAKLIDALYSNEESDSIITNDIKPHNMLIHLPSCKVELIDYGVGEVRSGETKEIDTKGTPIYMNPEQVNGLEQDLKSQVNAFAKSVYQFLTGHRPHFVNFDDPYIIMEEISKTMRLPQTGRDTINNSPIYNQRARKEIIAVLDKALGPRNTCYESCQEMIADLRQRLQKCGNWE